MATKLFCSKGLQLDSVWIIFAPVLLFSDDVLHCLSFPLIAFTSWKFSKMGSCPEVRHPFISFSVRSFFKCLISFHIRCGSNKTYFSASFSSNYTVCIYSLSSLLPFMIDMHTMITDVQMWESILGCLEISSATTINLKHFSLFSGKFLGQGQKAEHSFQKKCHKNSL